MWIFVDRYSIRKPILVTLQLSYLLQCMLDFMSEKAARRFEETRNKGDADRSQPPAPPEPIYDMTMGDDKDMVKAATARERGEKP